jgi:NAD-dependent SIR2 family protein deacetylase
MNKEESKEDIDLNPLNHFRESNIIEVNGNILYMKCSDPVGKCKKFYKRNEMFSKDKSIPYCPMCKCKAKYDILLFLLNSYSPLLKFCLEKKDMKNMLDEIETIAFKMDCLIILGSAV